MNAAKLDRMFAKPFVGSLDGHRDGVYCMAKNRKSLCDIASASADGDIIAWDLNERSESWRVSNAHRGFIRGLCYNQHNGLAPQLLSCGDDKTVKVWQPNVSQEPVLVLKGKNMFSGIDQHATKAVMATSGTQIDIWDQQRTTPVSTMNWGHDTINTVKFN